MKVLFDYQGFIQRVGGVSRYHVELIRHFTRVEGILPPLFSENLYLSEIGVRRLNPFPQIHLPFLRKNAYKVMDQLISLYFLERGDYDIFHPTYLNPYYLRHVKGKPVVVTIHDLIQEKMERFDSRKIRRRRKKVLKKVDAVIAISEQTKRDLLHFYDLDEKKVTVVYHGIDPTPVACDGPAPYTFPYLLYIGTRAYHKNFKAFLRAFAQVQGDIRLVCTGFPFQAEELSLIRQLGLEGRIIQQFVSDEELTRLLGHALAFVFPSLMEGFGLPILEAWRCGCPCIISDIPCFREVADDAALYFCPESVDDMAAVMNRAIEDAPLLRGVKEKAARRLELFTLDKTARETEEVYFSL
ncbi:MAG: glycosyltransferase family 4 protein [Porphyromonadaceae bacterium]|nr:glycosyltransferase family 4 protein [Porphyromonadaceae bacterium]